MSFKDHFSGHANTYARFRPGYPPALYEWLVAQCARREHAWDCATGNGQAARALAGHFQRVTATDASSAQIENAPACEGVTFAVAPAEASGLADDSVDLISVAQALHWFDIPRFFTHAAQVLRRDGVVAVWTYEMCTINPQIDALIDHFYRQTLDGWWPPERDLVDSGYRGILPDWPRLQPPTLAITQSWLADDLLGYLSSWSAVQRCIAGTGSDPLAGIDTALRELWGPQARDVHWPLIVHALAHPESR